MASLVEMQGKGYVVDAVGAYSGYIPFTAYSAKQSYMKKNPEIIQKFTNAIYKGMQWVHSHSDEEVAKSMQPHFPDADLEILTKVVERYRSIDAWATDPILKEDGFDRMQDVMTEAGELDKRAPYDKIVNTKFAEEAMKNK